MYGAWFPTESCTEVCIALLAFLPWIYTPILLSRYSSSLFDDVSAVSSSTDQAAFYYLLWRIGVHFASAYFLNYERFYSIISVLASQAWIVSCYFLDQASLRHSFLASNAFLLPNYQYTHIRPRSHMTTITITDTHN